LENIWKKVVTACFSESCIKICSQTFLDQRAAGMSSRLGEGWQELHKYRNSLVRGATDQPPVASEGAYSCEKKEYAGEVFFVTYQISLI
jgi:hypothetical protein